MNFENNVYKILPPELQQEMIQFCSEILEQYGPDPATKHQAAAHEAGHVIIATAIGEVVTGARIFRKNGGWYGRNYRQGSKELSTINDNPILGLKAICNNLAGKIGEEMAGFDYAASSVDELYRALALSRAFDGHMGWPSGSCFHYGTEIVRKTLSKSRHEFDLVHRRIEQEAGITRKSLSPILKEIGSYDIFNLPEKDRLSSHRIKELIDSILRPGEDE